MDDRKLLVGHRFGLLLVAVLTPGRVEGSYVDWAVYYSTRTPYLTELTQAPLVASTGDKLFPSTSQAAQALVEETFGDINVLDQDGEPCKLSAIPYRE